MKDIKIKEINITEGLKDRNKLLVVSGRDNGINQRKKFDLDSKDKDSLNYIIEIPVNIIVLASSFFLGAFGDSVRYFGNRDKFIEKYKFPVRVTNSVNNGIDDALKEVSVFKNE